MCACILQGQTLEAATAIIEFVPLIGSNKPHIQDKHSHDNSSYHHSYSNNDPRSKSEPGSHIPFATDAKSDILFRMNKDCIHCMAVHYIGPL